MKKIYFLFLFALIASLMGGANAADIFYESFDQCAGTGGNDDQFSGNIASAKLISDNDNWSFSNGAGAKQCAKFGSSSKLGKATTPVLANLNGNATLTFKAAAWKGDATTLKLSIEGGGSLSVESVTLVNSQFSDYKVEINGGTSESKITFSAEKASKNRFFLDEVKIVTAAAPTEVTAPVISGVENGATYVSTATVNISYPELATSVTYSITKEGATETPKTAIAAVEETITEAGTYTVKASATDGNNTKEAEAVTFTVVEQPKAASIAEFIALGGELAEGSEIEFTCPLTVTYQNGSRLYVKDAEGSALLIYGNVGQTYTNGDVIPAGAKGTYKLYNGNTPELENPTNFAAATEKAEANPTEMAITAVTTGDVNKYIVLKGVTVDATAKTLTDAAGNKIAFFDTFKLNNTPVDGNTYNVTAIVSIYDNAVQVAPIKYETAQVTTVAAPEFSLEEGTFNAAQTLTISCPTEGATITYTVEGGAEDIVDEGTSPVTIELSAVNGAATTYTVTAQATLGEISSAEVTKTYTIDPNASVEQTATIDMKEVAAENGWDVASGNTGTQYTSFEKTGFGFEVTEEGQYSGRYFQSSETSYSWRMYKGTNLTVTAPANTTIYGITFVKDSKWDLTMTADNGTVAEEDKTTWTSETGASTVTFTFTGKSGRCEIKQINISYITKTSGVEAVEAGNEVITVEGSNIVVKAEAATAIVYNAAGQLVRVENVDGEATIAVPTGFYAVKAGNTVAKVIVK